MRTAELVRLARRHVGVPLGLQLGIMRQHAPRVRVEPPHEAPPAAPDDPPSISLVTPSFEQGRFLEATIRSVIEQEYPRLEYWVQDGGSQDDSVAVLRRYEPRLAGWASERDAGQASAINRGFARSTGGIMAWLNSDDLLLPGALSAVARHFRAHPECDVVYGHRVIVDEQGREVGRWLLPRHGPHTAAWNDFIPQETMFWRRRLWERTGGHVRDDLQFALDWELVLRFRAAGARFFRIPRFVGAFRVHGEQKSSVARMDAVAAAEIAGLRAAYLRTRRARLVARLADAGYLLSSMGQAWRDRLGLPLR